MRQPPRNFGLGVLGVISTAAVTGWARYLRRRQDTWRVTLAQRIPLHSKFWRERKREDGDLLYVAIGDDGAH